MNVYTVICESSRSDTLVELYHNYDDAFKEAKDQMLMEIDRVYGCDIFDEEGVKFQDYPKILHDKGCIITYELSIEILKKEVR
uniref:Uncharacterized protein n=1 Tax=Pithovirus LCPAC401 TaxID=2506595 RepID=A0A481Z9C6_9VIRU|nr:MAG: hypothetical protein LCPAC401_00450 [Pithovirus LCPAC401]